MRYFNILSFVFLSLAFQSCSKQGDSSHSFKNDPKEIQAIKTVLNHQASDWSEGSLENFMKGYWNSDSLMFVGANGITYGWQETLDNYKERYPSSDHTGELDFDVLYLQKIGPVNYYMIGKFRLARKVGDASGYFSLLWKKIDGEWKIVVDHTG